MMKDKKFLIIEAVALLILVVLIIFVFNVDLNLGVVKLTSQKTLMSEYKSMQGLDSRLMNAKNNYESSISAVESAKAEYKKEKEKYEAISDETIRIIKEANTEEKYNIEFMWVKLGSYAKSNNLTLSLIEPGSEVKTETTTTQPTQQTTTEANKNVPEVSSSNEFRISVKGDYIDVSSFIFDIENDAELRFKLDKIKMEYAGSNQINASFVVKNLKFVK